MNRYTVSSLIGEGSFGRVYKATRKDDAQVVAIKVISKRGRSTRELKNLRRECDIQAHLKHPNVIEMLESFETRNDLVVVTEFALIDLQRFMGRHGVFVEERAQGLICNLVSALYYLHSHRILHRDLKPQNVLLNEDMNAKLCDFGLARNMTTRTHVLTSIKGTPLYMAPELLAEKPYDHQADLWSLGCIAYESMAGQPPFCTTSILHLVKMIKHEEIKWPSFLSSDCRSFLQGLLEKDPSLRVSWAQILCHPFVEGKLFISGIKADNSPFVNPQPNKKQNKTSNSLAAERNCRSMLSSFDALQLDGGDGVDHKLTENISSSRDSINAIPPSDIENIETDTEDQINFVSVPFAEKSYKDELPRSPTRQKPHLAKLIAEAGVVPAINANTCFVSGNNNMILNNFNDNFIVASTTNRAAMIEDSHPQPQQSPRAESIASLKKSRNKDLEKRKLSQNLVNFSLRLGQQPEMVDVQRKCTTASTTERHERDKEKMKESKTRASTKSSTQSADEQQSANNSPPCLLPGWDSCDDSQSPPIENDEWLAFLNRSIQEVLDGELDSLQQHNLVSIIVAPLRNATAIPRVIDCVASLLSLPFLDTDTDSNIMESIKTVYVDVKLVPNLMYASKLLIYQRNSDNSASSTSRSLRPLSELEPEEMRTARYLYELICHLVHVRHEFLAQFCDAVAILAANDLLISCLNHDYTNASALRIACCVLALFCCVLREMPENAELVEKIIFSSKLNIVDLLGNANGQLRTRMCMLLRLLARFSMRSLQAIWCRNIKKAIENLANDSNADVREEAECTLDELRQFSFYA